MLHHPYRTLASIEEPRESTRVFLDDHARGGLEEHAVKVVFFVVGALGVLVGIVHEECSVELSIGMLLLMFTVRWSIGSMRRRRTHHVTRTRTDERST